MGQQTHSAAAHPSSPCRCLHCAGQRRLHQSVLCTLAFPTIFYVLNMWNAWFGGLGPVAPAFYASSQNRDGIHVEVDWRKAPSPPLKPASDADQFKGSNINNTLRHFGEATSEGFLVSESCSA